MVIDVLFFNGDLMVMLNALAITIIAKALSITIKALPLKHYH